MSCLYLDCANTNILPVSRHLQKERTSEAQLKTFHEKYGGSARSAYNYAADPSLYEDSLFTKLPTLSFQSLDSLIRNQASTSPTTAPDSLPISHQLFNVFPGDTRHTPSLVIPSRYLYDKLRKCLSNHQLEATSRLYSMLIQLPATRGAAGFPLEDWVNDVFPKGGKWEIKALKFNPPGPKFTHWTNDPAAPTRYLCLGYKEELITIH